MKKLRSIQVLRAVAAIAVVIYHATHSRFVTGAAGVDLFFVISGFIIAKVAKGRSRLEFAADRAWRIFPLYFLCLALFVALVPVDRTACRDVASFTLLPIGCESYLRPAWSLAFELLFYFLMTLSIDQPRLLVPLVLSVLLLPPISVTGNNTLVLEFLAGVAIALAPLNRRLGTLALALGVPAFFAMPELAFWRFAAWGIPAAMIVYGALALEDRFAHRLWDWPVRLGDASYSIYLTHYILHRVVPMWWPLEVYAFVSIGYFVHKFVERPIMRLKPHIAYQGAVVLK